MGLKAQRGPGGKALIMANVINLTVDMTTFSTVGQSDSALINSPG